MTIHKPLSTFLFGSAEKSRIRFLLLVAIIFSLKIIYLLFRGITVQPDSYHYLICIINYDYPPFYPYFLRLITSIWDNLLFVGVIQTIFFAVGASVFLMLTSSNFKKLVLLAIAFGLDPISGFYCSSILSEALFIPILLIILGLVYRWIQSPTLLYAFSIGISLGLLYEIRFAGMIVIPFIVGLVWLRGSLRKKMLVGTLLIIAGFQLVILPVRLKFKQTFNTYATNGFTGISLWNNASVLWPESKKGFSHNNDFEKYLLSQPDSVFTIKNAIDALQISDASLPHLGYVKKQGRGFADKYQTAQELGGTGIKLIVTHPIDYFIRFAIPNYYKPISNSEVCVEQFQFDYYESHYGINAHRTINYSHYSWWSILLLLVLSNFLYLFSGRSKLSFIIILFCWYYILILPLIAAMSLRYYFILSPLVITVIINELFFFYHNRIDVILKVNHNE